MGTRSTRRTLDARSVADLRHAVRINSGRGSVSSSASSCLVAVGPKSEAFPSFQVPSSCGAPCMVTRLQHLEDAVTRTINGLSDAHLHRDTSVRVRRREHPSKFRRYSSSHGRQIRLSLEEYRELQDRRRRASAVCVDVSEGALSLSPSTIRPICSGVRVHFCAIENDASRGLVKLFLKLDRRNIVPYLLQCDF